MSEAASNLLRRIEGLVRRVVPAPIREALWRALGAPVMRVSDRVLGDDTIPLQWHRSRNWGDAISPTLVELLSGRNVRYVGSTRRHRYSAVGSILDRADGYTEVWGSGFIEEPIAPPVPPRAIHAVRGPLTRGAYITAGIACPEVYGDPALLLPRFFDPDVPRRHSVGVIPHFVDKRHPWVVRQRGDPDVCIIDVEGDPWEFVKGVKSCEVVLSSSLHGLICADAYGVPSLWVSLTGKTLGGSFKFWDYYQSIGVAASHPVPVTAESRVRDLVRASERHPVTLDLRALLLACPFLAPSLRDIVAGEAARPVGQIDGTQ